MNKIRCSLRADLVSSRSEPAGETRLRKLFAGKHKMHIALLVAERHAIAKRTCTFRPSNIDTQCVVHPYSGYIDGLVAERFHHLVQLRLRPFSRHFGDKTDDS